MKRILFSLLLSLVTLAVFAPGSLPRVSAQAAKDEDKPLRATLAKDSETKPTTSFTADVPKIYAFWIGDGVEKGDSIRCVWIAEDVGEAAPKETKIDEATLEATKDKATGSFSLSKPNNGWPVGKYRVELYVEDELVETLKFTIAAK